MLSDRDGDYYCLTCGSTDVETYELDDGTVHIYCEEDDCGWIHRKVAPGIFLKGVTDER